MVFPDSVSQIRGVKKKIVDIRSSPWSLKAKAAGVRWVEFYGEPASSSTIVMEQCSDSMNRYQALSTAGKPIYGWVGVVNRTIVEMNGKSGCAVFNRDQGARPIVACAECVPAASDRRQSAGFTREAGRRRHEQPWS